MLNPYSGDDRERRRRLGSAYVTSVADTDSSGTRVYRINSFGFRGDEPDPEARPRIFAFGCSHTFGSGLGLEETWPARFAELWAESRGCAPADLAVVNFGEGGASNDYIARMILSQSTAWRPDLVLALFTTDHRLEAFAELEPFKVGDWVRYRGVERWFRMFVPGHPGVEHHRWAATHYYRLRSAGDVLINALKNLLLAQLYCAERSIPYLASWVDHRCLDRAEVKEHAVFGPLLALLDRRRLVDFSIYDPEIAVDHAADGAHCGPRTHRELARRLFAAFEAHLGPELDRGPG